MEPNQIQKTPSMSSGQAKTSAKDFFLNLGAIVALYTVVVALINLLFTVINTAFPKITNAYQYFGSSSISFPVATLIIFFPIYVLLMWILEKGFMTEPDKRHVNVRRWLTFITLFIAGLVSAGDLVTVLYYFLDGQELSTAFLLKALVVLLVACGVFMYYISDIRNRLSSLSRKIWLGIALVFVIASIIWGFVVIGSPRTQQLFKYDIQKISDLQNLDSQVQSYYYSKNTLPETMADITGMAYYLNAKDPQTGVSYVYEKVDVANYKLCAVFNKDSQDDVNNKTMYIGGYNANWTHPAGQYCFPRTVDQQKGIPAPIR
ncbi:MAG: hypothetical protein QG589_223 [Patescibacteria group bacterium]|nr:hypothetical protein [Patescibacteria group bacterium]